MLVNLGLAFLEMNTEKLLTGMKKGSYPRWFAITFPGMIELARKIGLQLPFSDLLLIDVFNTRRQILESYVIFHLVTYMDNVIDSHFKHSTCGGSKIK